VTCAGWLGGGDERARLGLEGGPEAIVTKPVRHGLRARDQGHAVGLDPPGVSVDDVQGATGFEVIVPDGGVPETPAPTEQDVRLIREEIDPDARGLREFTA